MEIEILYQTQELLGKRSNGLPTFTDVKKFWKTKTIEFMTTKATSEALDKFYEWANENKVGALVLKITYLDFV